MEKLSVLSNRKEVEDYIKENPSVGRVRIARMFGLTDSQAGRLVKQIRRNKIRRASMGFDRAISVEDFRQKFDMVARVREGLKELSESGKVIYDTDFRIALEISATLWRRVVDREEFEKFQLQVRGKVIWGGAEALESIKRTIDVL